MTGVHIGNIEYNYVYVIIYRLVFVLHACSVSGVYRLYIRP
jgi:hypothetical protein